MDAVSRSTRQDVGELDRDAVERDHGGAHAAFECPIYRVEYDKARGRSWPLACVLCRYLFAAPSAPASGAASALVLA